MIKTLEKFEVQNQRVYLHENDGKYYPNTQILKYGQWVTVARIDTDDIQEANRIYEHYVCEALLIECERVTGAIKEMDIEDKFTMSYDPLFMKDGESNDGSKKTSGTN